MDNLISWLFDLITVIGTIVMVIPVLTLTDKKISRMCLVDGLTDRDNNEFKPQVKYARVGIFIAVVGLLAKLMYLLITGS